MLNLLKRNANLSLQVMVLLSEEIAADANGIEDGDLAISGSRH